MKSSLTARRVQPWKIEPRQEPRSREERVDLVDIAVQELAIRRTRPRRQEPARPWASNAVPSTTPTSGTRSCIPSSTTNPEGPMPRSTTTKPLTPLLGCCAARWVGLAPAESALPASCAITVSVIAHTPGATPAPNCRFSTSGRDPIAPGPTARFERFHRTMANEWAFARHYPNELARRSALPAWLHIYSHRRQHSAIGQGPTHHVIDQPAWAVHLALLLLIFASTNQHSRPGLVSGPTPAPDCRSPE